MADRDLLGAARRRGRLGVPDWSDATGITIALAALAVIFIVLPLAPTDLEARRPR